MPSHGSGEASVPDTPPMATPAAPSGVEFVTPPSDVSPISDDALPWHRTLVNIYDNTSEVKHKYDGLCLMVAEEPRSFAKAEKYKCW